MNQAFSCINKENNVSQFSYDLQGFLSGSFVTYLLILFKNLYFLSSPLTGLFFRTLTFLEHDIKPVFVFDGKPPEEKLPVVSDTVFFLTQPNTEHILHVCVRRSLVWERFIGILLCAHTTNWTGHP